MSAVFRDGLFAGKSAFFTGGTSGIGLGIAERFAELGAVVALLGRNIERMEAAVATIRDRGHTAAGYAADVRSYCSDAASYVTGAVYVCDGGHGLGASNRFVQ